MLHDEPTNLAKTITPRYRALILTAGSTGLRFSELAGVEIRHLHMLKRTLRIEQAMIDIGGRVALGPTKTAHSRRAVDLPAFLVEELAAHLAAFPGGDGLVFTAALGGPLRRTGVKGLSWSRVSDSNR